MFGYLTDREPNLGPLVYELERATNLSTPALIGQLRKSGMQL